jgi:hypothetical protein
MGDVGHVCTTPNACACSGSDDECCCSYPHDAEPCGPCVVCGAAIVAIDVDTGEPLP